MNCLPTCAGRGLTTFARTLAALRVSVLVIAGRVGAAERAWGREALPKESAGCVDLSAQTWREMEAVSEARARLLIGLERFDEARTLLGQLCAVAAERSFRKIEMRASALSITLEQHAGDTEASRGHLAEYLRLFAESPYAWPLLRERATCAVLLRRHLDADSDSPHRQAARSLLAAMRRVNVVPIRRSASVSGRCLRLAGNRDKEIAAALGISAHGVRVSPAQAVRQAGYGQAGRGRTPGQGIRCGSGRLLNRTSGGCSSRRSASGGSPSRRRSGVLIPDTHVGYTADTNRLRDFATTTRLPS